MTEDGEVSERVCASCGAFLEIDAESCIICGTPVELTADASNGKESVEDVPVQDDIPTEKECPGCGSFLAASDSECFICGHNFDQEAEVEPTTEAPAEEAPGPEKQRPEPTPPSDLPEPMPDAPQPAPGAGQPEDWDMGIVGGENGDAVEIEDDLEGIPNLNEPAAAEPEDTVEEIEEVEDVADDIEPAAEAPELGPDEFACPSCNKPVTLGSEKCPNCWADLSQVVACPACGEMVSSESDTCSKCFASLGLAAAVVDTPSETEAIPDFIDDSEPDLTISEDEEYYEEDYYEEELIEEYGLECPFCHSIERPDTDICTECGMPMIETEDGELPFKKRDWTPRKKQEDDYQKKVAVVLVFVLLVSALMPFLFALPQVDRERVRIDGAFGDWAPITNHTDMIEGLNPNVDINNFKVVNDAFNLYFYMEVEGDAFGDPDGNTARIFIDRDQDDTTGYSVEGIGAEYMLRVFGHDGQVTSSSCNRFDSTFASNDFNGFSSFCPSVPHAAENKNDSAKFEVRVALDSLVDDFDQGMNVTTPVTAVYYMADTQGDYDFSDYPVASRGGLLYVEQTSLVPANGIINLTSATPVLNLDLMAVGEDVAISNINLANNPNHALSATPTDVVTGNVTSVTVNCNAVAYGSTSFVNTVFTEADFTTDVDVVVRGQGAFGYAGSAPSLIEIDGAFADWASKGVDNWDASDDVTNKNLVDSIDAPNLDINNTKAANENNYLNIYVNVEGQMMAGMWVPEKEERYSGNINSDETTRADDVPDYQYSEPQVEQTRAIDLVRPPKDTPSLADYVPKTGEDAVMIYLDTDGIPGTGYEVGDIGADRLMVIYGQDGAVTSTEFLTYDISPIDPDYGILAEWDLSGYVPEAAASGSGLEARLDLNAFTTLETNTNASAFIKVVNWDDGGDSTELPVEDVFDVAKRRGSRASPGIPPLGMAGRVFQGDGVTLAQGCTVVAIDTVTNKVVVDYTNGNTDPFYPNFKIWSNGASGHNIDLYASNDTHYGTATYVYSEKFTDADFMLDTLIPAEAPYDLDPSNLAVPTEAPKEIRLDWEYDNLPDEFRIFRSLGISEIVGEFYYLGVGHYYGDTPIDTIDYGGKSTGNSPNINENWQDPNAIGNATNYYIVQSNSGPNSYYSQEVGILADFWAANFTHTNITYWSGSYVPVNVVLSDGVGNVNGTVHYRKVGTSTWYSRELTWVSGSNFTGANYTATIPLDYTSGSTSYEYYIAYSDGTFDSFWGSPGVPVTFTADTPPTDPYPVYGFVTWGDGTIVGPGVDVFIEWTNITGVVINDPLPGNFPFVTNAASQYSVDVMDYDSNTMIWGNASVNIGGTWYYGYNSTPAFVPSFGGWMMNITLEAPALNITKTAPATALAGDTIMYTLMITNTGNTTAYNINVTEEYSSWVNYSDSSIPPDFGDNVWNGSIPDLAPGESYAIYINVSISGLAPLGTDVINNATVQLTGLVGMVFPGDSDTATTTIGAAVLEMTKWAPATANTGQTITYWLNYTNSGSEPASNVVITETYPAGVTFVSSIPAPTIGNNVWLFAWLPAGASNSIAITVMVDANASGILNNTALMTGYDEFGVVVLENTTAWANTTVIDPSMTVTKVGPGLVNTDETIMYTITYFNSGTDDAYNVVITETYDPGVTFVNATPPADIGSNVWLIGTVPAGTGGTIFINVTVDALAGSITNLVELEYEDSVGEVQPVESDTVVSDIENPDMVITKNAPATANTGETIMYTITYFNNGGDDAENVVITDTYDLGVSFVNATPPADIGNNVWLIGTVPAGTGGTIFINVTVNTGVSGWITNSVEMAYENAAGIAQTVIGDSADTWVADPYMVIVKDGQAFANSGETITYWLNYSNAGTGDAENVVITDVIPVGTTFVNSTPAPDGPANDTWTIGTVAPGASGSIEITVVIDVNFTGTLNNSVDMDYDDAAHQSYPTVSDWFITVVDNPTMTIEKTAPASGSPLGMLDYYIYYNNTGTDTAYNVIITETYPAGVTFINAVPPANIGNNVWLVGDLPPGFTGVIQVTVQVDAGTTGVLNNTVNMTYENLDGVTQPELGDYAVTTITWPVMEIQKYGPATATAGGDLYYVIFYNNTGTDTAYNVTITETYPANCSYNNSNPPVDIWDDTWLIGDIPAGTGGVIYLNLTIDVSAAGLLVNNVSLDYDIYATPISDIVYSEWQTFLSGPLMTVNKTVSDATANTGQEIMYTITWQNVGDDDAENVVITDVLPVGATFVNSTPAPDGPSNDTWTIGTVAPGATGVLYINATVDDWVISGSILVNTVDLDYENNAGISLPTVTDTAVTTVLDPSLTLVKTGPAEANTGETIMYTITVTNTGDANAEGVVVQELYDPGVTFVNATPPADIGNDIWLIGTMLPGEVIVIFINVTVDATSGSVINQVGAFYDDENAEAQPFEFDMVITDIINPLINITKEAPATAAPGQIITYWVNYTNLGNDWAYNVVINESYPPGDINFISAVPPADIGNNIWIIPAMAPGAIISIAITVEVDTGLGAGDVVTNIVTADYDNSVGIAQQNETAIAVTDIIDCLLTINKWAPAFANTGETITYWINITNIGAAMAYNISVDDGYPAGITIIGSVPPATIGDNYWFIPSLAPGATFSIMITATVDMGQAPGTVLTNTVDLDYENIGGVAYFDSDSASTTIIDPDMTIEKIGPATAAPGETITYMIWYNNTGTDDAYNVVITEIYPAGVSFVNATPAPSNLGLGDDVWNIGTVAPGNYVIYVTVMVSPTANGTLANTVTLDSENAFAPMQQKNDTFNGPTIIGPYIVITKSAPATAVVGETITYTITYQNTGPGWAYDVWINETYPADVTFNNSVPPANVSNNAWYIGNVPPNSGLYLITITVDVDSGATILINNVSVVYDTAGGLTFTDYDTATTLVNGPLLDVTKTGPAFANTGEIIYYDIVIENTGNAPAFNLEVTEVFPSGVTPIPALYNIAPTVSPYYWDWTTVPQLLMLMPGTSVTITVAVQINITTTGVITNLASVYYENSVGTSWPEVFDTASTTIIDPLLTVDKTAPAFANTGENITYTITVNNIGTDAAYDIWINETYPAEVSFVSAIPGATVGNDAWYIPVIAPGGTVVITITVQVIGAVSTTFTNLVDVNYTNEFRYMPEISDTADTTIHNPALTLTKEAPVDANTGQTITYWINITNTGDDWAYNIVVTEAYPAGTSFVGAVPAPTIPDNIWNIPALAPGGSYPIQITIAVDQTASGWLNNTVTLDFENAASISQPQLNATASTQVIDPLMTITKTGNAFATQDELITYTITYQNNGDDWAYNVIITETYPPGVSFVSAVPPADIGNNIWLIGNVAPGASSSITIQVVVDASATGTIVNSVTLTYEDEAGEAQTPVSDSWPTDIIRPILTVDKTAPATANTGETFTYTIEITNIGTDWAENVVIVDPIPVGTSFVGSNVPPIGPNTWDLSSWGLVQLNPGETIWLNITVMVTAPGGTLINTVTVDYTNFASFSYATVQDTATTDIINPLVQIDKSGPTYANTGQTITYWINVTNNGDDWAYNVWITETYPAEVSFVGAFPPADVGNNQWNVGTLAPGGTFFIQITVLVDVNASIGTFFTNLAEVDYDNADGATFTDSDTMTTEVVDPYIEIMKTGPAYAAPGDIITYMITIWNNGSDWAWVWINETFPSGTTFLNSSVEGYTPMPPDLGDNVWGPFMFPPDWNGTLFINVSIDPTTSGNITNLVEVEYFNPQGIAMTPVNATWTTLVQGPYVNIQKSGPATASEGETIMYEIYYENLGDNTAYGVWINDTYPANTTFVNATPAATVGDNTWYLGDLAPGQNGTIFINVTVGAGATILINYAFVNYTTDAAGNNSVNMTDLAITIVDSPWLTVDKTAPAFANPGETIMYTITIENIGTDTAYDVEVNETYPADVSFVNASIAPDISDNVWQIANITPGQTIVIFINVTVDLWTEGIVLENVVTVDYDNDGGLGLPTQIAWANTTVIDPEVDIYKEGPAEANPGETITYWLNYTNFGSDWAYDIVITEFYDPGVTFVGSIPPATSGNDVWIIPALAPGASGSIEITVVISMSASGWIWNDVEMEYNNTVGVMPGAPITASWATQIVNPNMTITKTAPATANPGEFITYTITYQNNGDDWAYNVIITEAYPVEVSYVSAIPAPDIGDNVWLIGIVAPGGSGSITITVQVNNGTWGTMNNWAYLDYENRIGTLMPPEEDSAATDIIMPELTISKDGPATANTGETIVYDIQITNNGNDSAYNVAVSDLLPAGVTLVSILPPLPSWTIPVLLPGFSWVGQVTVTVNTDAFGTLTNWAYADYEDSIGQTYPQISDFVDTTIIGPDMSINKTGPATANTGEIFMYTIDYFNSGSDDAYNVVIVETFPPGVTVLNWNPAPTFGTTWDIGTVPDGTGGTIFINVTVDNTTSGWQTNSVVLDYENGAGLAFPQESALVQTQIIDPQVSIVKTAPVSANTGQTITYWLNIMNSGNDWAYNIVVNDTYPAGVSFVGAVPPADIGNNVWLIGALAPGGTYSIMVTVSVNPTASSPQINSVVLDYENGAGHAFPTVQDTASTLIIDPYLVISKAAPATANPGEQIVYTITVQNLGNDAAYDVYVYEVYPAGISYFSAVPAPFIIDNTWYFPVIGPGATEVITITVDVSLSAAGPLTNYVYVNYTDAVGEFQPEDDDTAVTVVSGPVMEITKDATPYANPTDTITYWLNYTNTGTDTAYNVVITEFYDIDVTLISATPSPDIGDNVWLIGTVAPGGSGTIEITVQLSPTATGVIENIAEIEYENGVGIQYGPIEASAITVVGDTPNMIIIKMGPAQANPGQDIQFFLAYMNIGNSTAYNVTITEFYPFGLAFNNSFPPPTAGDNFWFIGTVLPGNSVGILINMTVTGDVYGVLSNLALMTYENSTGTNYTDIDTADVLIIEPLVEIDKTGPATATNGSTVMYTITYQNTGNDTAYDVVITDIYPPTSGFVNATPPPTNLGFGDDIWQIGDLLPGGGGTIFVNITLNNGPGNYVQFNNVTLDYNNSVNVSMGPVNASQMTVVDSLNSFMEVTKWASPTTNPGGVIMYIINWTNLGQGGATNVWLNETYPAGTAYLNSSILPTNFPDDWNIGNVPGGSSGTLYINVTVPPGASGILTNLIELESDSNDDYDFANTTVVNPAMTITKAGPEFAESNVLPVNIPYTIWINNTGTDTAYNVNVTETYPAGVTYQLASPAPDFNDFVGAATNTWIIGAIPVGGSVQIDVTVSVNSGLAAGLVLNNTVWLNYTNGAAVPRPTESDYALTTITDVIMTLQKDGPQTADPGETIIYTITYFNDGPGNAANVTITDVFDNVTYVNWSSSVGGVVNVSDNAWLVGMVPAGTGGTITVIVTVNNTAPDFIINQAMMNYTDTAGLDIWLNATALTSISGPLMTLSKSAPALATPGGTIMYTIYYENIGNGYATNVTIVENYPAGVSYVWSNIPPSSGDNVWNLGTLAPGDSGTIVIIVDVSIAAFGTLTNWVYLDYQNVSGGQQQRLWDTARTVVGIPSMVVEKTGPATVNEGGQITYTITYNNVGVGVATNIIIEDAYPAGLSYVGSTPTGFDTGTSIIWNLGSLVGGGSGVITVTFDVVGISAPGVFTNWAWLNYTDLSGSPDTDSDSVITVVNNPVMQITKWAPATATSGQTITYYLNYTNTGTDTADNVVITETYPAEVMFVSAIPAPTIPNNVWNIGTVAPGVSGSIAITVIIDAANGTVVTNDVDLDYDNLAGIVQPTESDSAATIIQDPDLTVIKTGPATANSGEVITYTIWIYNNGSADAYNLVVTETYPGEVSFVSAVPSPTSGDNVWLIPMLAIGATYTITIDVMVGTNVVAPVTATNNVTVDFEDEFGEAQSMKWDEIDTDIIDPLLSVGKSVDTAIANTGQTIMYTITVRNVGSDIAYNVNISEQYSQFVSFMNSTTDGSAAFPPTYSDDTWIIPSIPVGGIVTIFINVTIAQASTINNWVYVNYEDFVGEAQPQESAFAQTLVRDPYMTLSKTATAQTVAAGVIMYRIAYNNIGTGDAANVIITETYPAGITFLNASVNPDNLGTGNDTWTIGLVMAGTGGVLFINVTVDNNTVIGTVLTNDVALDYDNLAGMAGPQFTAFDTTLVVGPTLTVEKHAVNIGQTALITEIDEGDSFAYLIIVNNTGNGWAYNVMVNDTIPYGLEVTGGTTPSFVDNMTYYWNISQIGPGGTEIILLSVVANDTSPDWANNTAYVDYENSAGLAYPQVMDFVNITILHPAIVVTQPNVVVTKTAPSQALAGTQITYTIYYENIGDGTAYNLRIFESYPADTSFVNATPAPINIGNDIWDVGDLAPGENGTVTVTVYIFSYVLNNTLLTNWVDIIYEDNTTQTYGGSAFANTLVTAIIIPNTPPIIVPESPEFVYAGDNITIIGIVNDIEDYTVVQSVVIYYTDIFGVRYSAQMQASSPYNATTGDGWYSYEIPYQIWKGVVTFFIWAEDNLSASSSTGLYDVNVLIPPYYVWGHVRYSDGDPARDAILSLTNLETSETVIAVGDSNGNYIVDLGTLYSGYMDGENVDVYATDGSYYGNSTIVIQTSLFDDTTMNWPNQEANIVLAFIPEYQAIFVPLMLTLTLFIVYRRAQRKRREDDFEE